MKFDQYLAEDRRLAMLRLLIDMQGSANESVLQTGLEMLGHRAGLTRDAVREDLKFLNDRNLITLTWFSETVAVAKITRRGVEVAEGRERVDGVKIPALGD